MSKRPDGNPLICSNEECTGDVACAECSAEFDSTKSQTDNTELDEIKKTVWECIRYNEFNLSDTEAVGVIMQAVEAKLKQQDIKSRIDELEKWLALVTWPNNYLAMREEMQKHIDELSAKLRSKA